MTGKATKALVKADKQVVPYRPLSAKEYEEMRRKFYDEPTQEDLGKIFAEGIANGTLIADEDEDDFKYPDEPDSFRFSFFGKSSSSRAISRANVVHEGGGLPVTSTPFIRNPPASIYEIDESAERDDDDDDTKDEDDDDNDNDNEDDDVSIVKVKAPSKAKAPAKKRAPAKPRASARTKASAKGKGKGKAIEENEDDDEDEDEDGIPLTRLTVPPLTLMMFVDDGVGSHSLEISTRDDYGMLVTKVASKMNKPVHCVILGCETPWSSKVGQKKRPIYIISEHCLDHFWVTGTRHIDSKAVGRKSKAQVIDELGAAIVFVNMAEASQVRLHCPFIVYIC